MAALKQWARDIIVILLLAHALELVVPFGRSRRYVRLAVGLVLMLALLQPLLTLLRTDVATVLDEAMSHSEAPLAVDDRVQAVQAAQAVAAEALSQQLTEQAVAEVAARFGVRVSRVEALSESRLAIWATRGTGSDGEFVSGDEAAFVAAVAAQLDIDADAIDVMWQGMETGRGRRDGQ